MEANKGLSSSDVRPVRGPEAQRLLTPVDSMGAHIADFNGLVRQRCAQSYLDLAQSEGSMTTESYLADGRGQQFLSSAKHSLQAKLQQRMLQLLGGVFPCGLRSYRI
eukprot:3935219-Rhodomonas_salina.1